jgi:hypothetical protein
MSKVLTQSQHDTIRHLLETTSTPKSDIAQRFNCSTQTIYRAAAQMRARRVPIRQRTDDEIVAKRELDVAFSAFERCQSRDNYAMLDEARHNYEMVVGRLVKSTQRVHQLVG